MKSAKFEANFLFMNKNVTRRLICLVSLLLFFSATVSAQYYDIGSEKSSVKWKKMQSKNFEIIYPNGYFLYDGTYEKDSLYKDLAANYLKKMESLYGIYSDSVKYTYGIPKRFPLVLHPFNAESNGITVWAPRQIDFFAQPPIDVISTEPWDLSLASHEGRHAWQMAHMNRGFFKVLYWAFGDQAIGAVSGIYPSRWFLEGEAVVAETQMSNGGRGRNGFFLCEILKCIVPEGEDAGEHFYGKNRSWDRWRFGSVKAYSPSPYCTGYMINAMARHHSGDVDLAHKILNYEPLHFMSANVVASAFKEYTGKTHREFVKDSLLQEFLKLNLNEEFEETLSEESAESLLDNPVARTGYKQGYYTEYKHITAVGKDSVAAVVEGYGNSGYLVLFTKDAQNGSWKEKVLRPFNAEAERLSYHNGKLMWSECNTDPRWEQHSIYGVCSYDLKTGELKEYSDRIYPFSIHLPQKIQLNTTTDLFGIKYEPADKTCLLSSVRGNLDCWRFGEIPNGWEAAPVFGAKGQITSYALSRFKPDKNYYWSDWELFFTCLDENGLSLLRGREASPVQKTDTILPPSSHIIKDLTIYDGDLFFISDMFGLPTLCRMNPDTREIRLACASGDISSYSIAEDGTLYIIKEVGDLGELPFKEKLVSIAVDPKMEYNYPMAEELTRQYQEKYGKIAEEYQKKIEAEDSDMNFKETDYSKTSNLFKLHSWAPVYAEFTGVTEGDFEEFYDEALPGVSVYTQNTLGTMRASLGYGYEKRDGLLGKTKRLHSGHATVNWSGWYPVIEGTVHFNDRIMYDKDKFSLRSYAAAYIPLSWNGAGWSSGITPMVGWSYRNDEAELEKDATSPTGYRIEQFSRHQLNMSLGAYKSLEVAKAQVFPRWGIGARVASSLSPKGGDNFGSEYSAYVYGYVPGLTFNQGLRLSAAYQRQDVNGKKYWLDNHIDLPRGYTEDFFGRNYIRATADYAIPIYLGDVSLGPIAYLQQLQLIPFIDYSKVDFQRAAGGGAGTAPTIRYQWEDRYSFGADVMLRGHFLRIGFPMYIGVRYARTNKPGDYGNSTPATYGGKGGKDFCSLLLGITIY